MNLQPVEIPRTQAREAAAEYRRAAKALADPEARAEFEQIARAYAIAARDEVALIALTPTLLAGGTSKRTIVSYGWRDGERVETGRTHYLVPNLAVMRASATFCNTLGVRRDGSIEFVDKPNPSWNYRSGVRRFDVGFKIDTDYYKPGESLISGWHSRCFQAMVPIVPPKHRPPGTGSLASYEILWEVDEWAWTNVPRPPGDPALLKHVGGDIYAVVAVWDLTELEQLVLSGRRP